jgi:acetylornithine deacetylase/succinyl-diaminopimelate desuccinylase-like protein
MIDFTRELIGIASENPPGNEYALWAVVIAQKRKQIRLEPQVVAVLAIRPGKRAGILRDGVSRGREGMLHLHWHYDVVSRSVQGHSIRCSRDLTNLFGRGSFDMKGGLASMAYAVQFKPFGGYGCV